VNLKLSDLAPPIMCLRKSSTVIIFKDKNNFHCLSQGSSSNLTRVSYSVNVPSSPIKDYTHTHSKRDLFDAICPQKEACNRSFNEVQHQECNRLLSRRRAKLIN
jgi:hypothetical protein